MKDRERVKERGRDTGSERSRLHLGSLMWDSISGLQNHAPGLKAGVQPLSHPGVPTFIFKKEKKKNHTVLLSLVLKQNEKKRKKKKLLRT